MNRRDFLKKTGLLAAALTVVPTALIAKQKSLEDTLAELGFKQQLSLHHPHCESYSFYQSDKGNLYITKYKKGCGRAHHNHLPEMPWQASYYPWGRIHETCTSYAINDKYLAEGIAKWSIFNKSGGCG